MNARLTVTAAAATLAASVALTPLFSGWTWFWAGAGATVVVAAVGAATRARVFPATVCLLAGLAAESLYLNALFAGAQSWARVVPTRASVNHLGALVSAGMNQVARYAPPVRPTTGILLLTAAGIGLIAVLTDLIAVRLRKPAVAGLPLLVLFCVPLTTGTSSTGAGAVVVFCLGMAGYLALLLADGRDRLRLWGRVVRTWEDRPQAHEPDTRHLAAAGRRIGLAAVVIALAVPLVLPSLSQHRLFASTGIAGDGPGGGAPIALPQPLVQLNNDLRLRQPRTVLTYQSTTGPHYLQVYVLTRLAADAWTLAPPGNSVRVGSGPLPSPPGLKPGTSVVTERETIALSTSFSHGATTLAYLPVPYAPRTVSVPGQWRVSKSSLGIFSAGTAMSGLRYTVTSERPDPLPQTLATASAAPAALHSYLTYPKVFSQLRQLARSITAGAHSPEAKAAALQRWFRAPGRFTYTLSASQPDTAHALLNFLTRDRSGYCQQFAFAMAVLARLVGIPSRVVVGYTGGTRVHGDTWLVTTSDAHAWPELYFQGFGWLRFEPTPSAPGGLGQATATVPRYTYAVSSGSHPHPRSTAPVTQPTGPGAATQGSGAAAGPRRKPGSGDHASGGGTAAPGGSLPIVPVLLALLALGAVTPRTVRSVTRRRRWLGARDDTARACAAWRELTDDLTDYRIAVRPSETPRALARRLGGSLDFAVTDREALERIARAAERAGYATSPLPSGQLPDDVATVRHALAAAAGGPARWSARLLPASVLAQARTAAQKAFDAYGRMDALWSRLRRRPTAGDEEAAYSWRG